MPPSRDLVSLGRVLVSFSATSDDMEGLHELRWQMLNGRPRHRKFGFNNTPPADPSKAFLGANLEKYKIHRQWSWCVPNQVTRTHLIIAGPPIAEFILDDQHARCNVLRRWINQKPGIWQQPPSSFMTEAVLADENGCASIVAWQERKEGK
jgi:hypothetical protein